MRSALSFFVLLAAFLAVFGVPSAFALGVTSPSSNASCTENLYGGFSCAYVPVSRSVFGLSGVHQVLPLGSFPDGCALGSDGNVILGVSTPSVCSALSSYGPFLSVSSYAGGTFLVGIRVDGSVKFVADGAYYSQTFADSFQASLFPGTGWKRVVVDPDNSLGCGIKSDGTSNCGSGTYLDVTGTVDSYNVFYYALLRTDGTVETNKASLSAFFAASTWKRIYFGGSSRHWSDGYAWEAGGIRSDDTIAFSSTVSPSGTFSSIQMRRPSDGNCAVSTSNVWYCFNPDGTFSSSSDASPPPPSGGSVQLDPNLLCVDNPSGSGSVSFASFVATGTGYEYDLSFSAVDETWTYPSERSLWLKGVDIAGHSDGPSLAAGGTGRFVVEKGSVFSFFDDPFLEVRALTGSINFYRAFFTGSTEYEYKTVYVENGSGNDATFFRRIVDVTASELRTVGGFSFVMPKPLDGYRPVGFRVVLKSDDRYYFSEFRLGTYSLSADSCVPDSSGASPDPSAGSGSGSSVPPSSSVPGSPDVVLSVPDYPTVDQSCVPKYFSGSFVSVATSENLDPSSCAWRTVSGSFRCQDSGGHLCSVDADSCLPEIANPSQYSSGSVEYTGDVTRYECSAGSVSCLWYSKKTCGPSASCYRDGDYCRVKPGEENPDYSSALGTVTYSGTPAVDSSLDISNLGAFGTGRVSVSGVSHGVGSFSGVAPLTALTESGFCDMFNSDGSFAYYSDGEPFAVTLSVSGIIPISWIENNIVPHVDRLIGSVTAPVNNLGAVFRTLGTFPEGSKICVLGRVAEVRYQSALKSLDDEKHVVGFQYGRMGFFDYLFLFVFGVIALLFAKKSLSNL